MGTTIPNPPLYFNLPEKTSASTRDIFIFKGMV